MTVQPRGIEWSRALRDVRPILQPGRNAWRVERAERAGVIADGAPYFRALHRAFERARRSILVLGWDFDASVALDPLGGGRAALPLREYLAHLLEDHPELEVRILVWGFSVVYGASVAPPPPLDRGWPRHPRLAFRFANDHPLGACHHQKLVCVDDSLAFCGGQDITSGRWDERTHDPVQPARTDARGRSHPPRHDVQLVVDGPAAAALAELARARWRAATGESVPPCAPACEWNEELPVHLSGVRAGIARTCARRGRAEAIREVEALTLDALAAAREHVYVEAQYLTSLAVRDLLERMLARDDCPEIVVVAQQRNVGLLQGTYLGRNRERFLRRLARADRRGRLRVYHPVVCDDEGRAHPIDVHSKLIAVDDRFLKVGSANLANRSMGFDSECDVALEAADGDARARAGLRSVVCSLLGEHVGRGAEEVEALLAAGRGLFGALEELNGGARRLVRCEVASEGPTEPFPLTRLFDPFDGPERAASPLALPSGRRAASAGP